MSSKKRMAENKEMGSATGNGVHVFLAGGGTAGHVNPLIATALELKSRGFEVSAIGTKSGLESELIPLAGINFLEIDKVPLPRSISKDLFSLPSRLRKAKKQVQTYFESYQASAVVGFGGYVCPPVYLQSKKQGVPIVVHEANARAGIANKLGARSAQAVAVTFANTGLRADEIVVGLPLRPQISALLEPNHRQVIREQVWQEFGWKTDQDNSDNTKVMLVTGGSLGAATINEAVLDSLSQLLTLGFRVIHVTGKGKVAEALDAKNQLAVDIQANYQVVEYAHEMEKLYAAADLVLCRSGAGTVAEISALGLPALYVPLAIGNGEQALNAAGAVDAGAAKIILNSELTTSRLLAELGDIIADPTTLTRMQKATDAVARRDAAARLAEIIAGVVNV